MCHVLNILDKYDERSARQHVKRLVDILEKPPILTLLTQNGPEEATLAATTPRSRSQSQASQNNAQDGAEVPDQNAASSTAASATEE